ncbi:ATP-grasp domain-containing protein [Streptomyces ficellus]|uniref:ATP-grasp domain-containing protein n=1 Tax=Streptomyces ficellus TaxID=1977088 RepID=A0ABT7Z6C9_9ACTN|nr:ATP-grasp domain-containing protein [Streptomyces ficellus]MDN3295059.1 ATP-grasp domain-containing protein [Streptomyces ficellus]
MLVLVNPVSTGTRLAEALREEGADFLSLYEAHLGPARDADTTSPRTLTHHSTDTTLAALRELKPTAVIAASEYGVLLADALAHELGLDHHRPEQAAARRDKQLMVRALEAAAVPAARTRSVGTERELAQALDEVPGYPVMVKPRDSAGSDGCTICHTRQEALDAYRATAHRTNLMGGRNDHVLIQEFLTGTQYIVNTVSMAGRHLLTEVYAERIDRTEGAPVLRHIISRPTLTPAEADMADYVFRCLDALGIREGAAHTEVMLTAHGPRLIEVNSRIMGPSLAPDPYHAAFGYSHQHLVAERFLRPDDFARRFETPYGAARAVAKIFLRPHRAGVLLAADGVRTLRRLPGFHSIDRLPVVGEPLRDRHLTTGACGIAYLVHEDEDLLRHSLDVVHDMEDAGLFYRLGPEE